MRRVIVCITLLTAIVSLPTCDIPDEICPDITYKHRAMMYVKLGEGMVLNFTSLDNLTFLSSISPYNSYEYTVSSNIVSKGGKADYLYPGTIKNVDIQSLFPIYDSIYNQSAYEEMCNEIGDHINEKFCYYEPPTALHSSGLNLYLGLLYNKLDSVKIVCVDKNFGSYSVGSSLNDTFNMRCVIVDPKVSYKDRSLVLPKNDKTNKPYMFDAKLKDFYTITGGGARFINVIDWSPEGYTMVINTTSPRIYLSGEGRANKEAYRFKLFFYMDDGKLVVESNEIVGYY